MRKRIAIGVAVATVSLVAAACGDDSSSSDATTAATTAAPGGATTAGSGGGTTVARTASDTGVTADKISIGFVASTTGAAGPNNTGMVKAAKARVALENDNGGVNGRKIDLVDADDQSDTTRNPAVIQQLVEGNKVFAVIANSPFVFAGYRYLQDKKLPTVVGGYDGSPYWTPGMEMFFPATVSVQGWNYDGLAKYAKDHGATKLGGIGYGQSPSSSASAKAFLDAGKSLGMDAPYLNTSVPFGGVDVAPIALALKQQNIDGLWMAMNNNTNFAIVTAAKQAGANLKAAISATGYGQDLLDQPTALAAAEGSYFSVGYQPVETGTAQVKAFQDALKKYANYTGVPDFGWYQGWISTDLMIQGLKAAGPNPTRDSLQKGLNSIKDYDANGLLASKTDYTPAGYGKQPEQSCGYYVKVTGGKYVPDPAPNGISCGKKIN
ncbi:MAG: ABC transporter substrate-binding protein [Acidimicrobiia bacterium]